MVPPPRQIPSLEVLHALRISLRPTLPRNLHTRTTRAQCSSRPWSTQHTVLQPRIPRSRSITTWSTPYERIRQSVSEARRDYPVLFPVLLIATLGSLSLLGLLAYDEATRVAPQFAAFPAPVEQQLRIALHYTHVDPDPEKAGERFVKALEIAEQIGMDGFSQEVMGIRIRFAEMLEGFGRVKGAIEVLNGIVRDCEERLVEVERGVLRRGLAKEGMSGVDEEEKEDERLRPVSLRGIIQAKVKISELYDSDYLRDSTMAKKTLSDAVQLLVSETQDPQTRGFSEDNKAGLTLDEIASMLSQMGDLYATSGEEANAVQVYMLTLDPLRKSCNGKRSCKEVQVLSNIASTMALAMDKPGAKINGQPVNEHNLKAARKATLAWADKAIDVAEVVKPEDRDSICQLGLLSAQMTRADLLLKDGKNLEARELFRSALPVLRENGLNSLVKVAEQGIQKAGG